LELTEILGLGITGFAASFILTYVLSRLLIPILTQRKLTVEDFHKPGKPRIPRPGGPAIITAIAAVEIGLFILLGDPRFLAVGMVSAVGGVIGLLDDFFTFSAIIKPAALVAAAVPILLLATYSFRPEFPFFGPLRLSLIYPVLILLAIPITANTINTIDVLNGAVSGFIAITTGPLLLALALKHDWVLFLASIPLLASASAFYLVHRNPSKIFPGDSGCLCYGATYGAIAIVGGVEFVGVVALLPAILNSFFLLSSTKKFVEHREIKVKPVDLGKDYLIRASKNTRAPITLVRLIVAERSLTENRIVREIHWLAIFASILAVVTALATWGFK